MSQSDSSEMAESNEEQHYSASEAMKLISVSFARDRRKVKEFTDKVTTAFELVTSEQDSLLLEFVITKMEQSIC
jgi:hypothetical protein